MAMKIASEKEEKKEIKKQNRIFFSFNLILMFMHEQRKELFLYIGKFFISKILSVWRKNIYK